MDLERVSRDILDPALLLLPKQMDSPQARILLMAFGLQESRFKHRYQILNRPGVKGPARGFWQFERGTEASRGGVWGVYLHDASRYWLSLVCGHRKIPFEPAAIWQAIETNDILAAVVARLLMFTDPYRLPDDSDGAWSLYMRTWRPGKPHPQTFPEFYRLATQQERSHAA